MAKKIGVSPGEVGFTADFLEMSIVKCQLGLFGYRPHKKIIKPAETVSKDLQRAIQELTSDGRIACKDAWAVAEKLKLKKMDISVDSFFLNKSELRKDGPVYKILKEFELKEV